MNTFEIPKIAERYLGAGLPPPIKCYGFISLVYHELGLSTDFSLQPDILFLEKFQTDWIGKMIFLNRILKQSYLFSHLAIIYGESSVIHYSRHSSEDGVRRVQITDFDSLFKTYHLVANPYLQRPRYVLQSCF